MNAFENIGSLIAALTPKKPDEKPKDGHCPCCGRHWKDADGTHCSRCTERLAPGPPPATPPEKGDCVHPREKKRSTP